MVPLKRRIYGLPFMRPYRVWRAKKTATRRPTEYGFELSSIPLVWEPNWEKAERDLTVRLVPRCRGFIDVGANHGFYALLANSLGAEVIAVEPDAGNLGVLRENLRGTPIEICPIGLSETCGTVDLYGDGVYASLESDWEGVDSFFRQPVQVTTLDEMLAGRWIGERLFFKIDVEGGEYKVLQGGPATIRRTPRPFWMIEIAQHYPTGGKSPHFIPIFEMMFDAGYRAYEIRETLIEITLDDLRARDGDKRGWPSNYLFSDLPPEALG